jgi:hypothetical protein
MAIDTQRREPEADGEVCIPINASEQIEFCYARGWTDGPHRGFGYATLVTTCQHRHG